MATIANNSVPQPVRREFSFFERLTSSWSNNLSSGKGAGELIEFFGKGMQIAQLNGYKFDEAIKATKITGKCMGLPLTVNFFLKAINSDNVSDITYNSCKTLSFGTGLTKSFGEFGLFSGAPDCLGLVGSGAGLTTYGMDLYKGLNDWSKSNEQVQRFYKENPQTPLAIQTRDERYQIQWEKRTLSLLKIGKSVIKAFLAIITIAGFFMGKAILSGPVLLGFSLVALTFSIVKEVYGDMTFGSEVEKKRAVLAKTNITFPQIQAARNLALNPVQGG